MLATVTTAELEVSVDATIALHLLKNGEKRISYAIANAINATALEIQKAQVAHLKSAYVLRSKGAAFIIRQASIIKPFANPGTAKSEQRLWAMISVGQKPGIFLPRTEVGGIRSPSPGAANVAIPIVGGARPSLETNVDPQFYLKALGLQRKGGPRPVGKYAYRARRGGSGTGTVLQGNLRTYLIPGVGVFQHIPGQRRGRILYLFKKSVRLPAKLKFVEIARAVADRVFGPTLFNQVNQAFTHSWGIGL